MNHPGFKPTYSDAEIYSLLRRVMADHQADPSTDVMPPTPTRAPAISPPAIRMRNEPSFDEILKTIRGEITND